MHLPTYKTKKKSEIHCVTANMFIEVSTSYNMKRCIQTIIAFYLLFTCACKKSNNSSDKQKLHLLSL